MKFDYILVIASVVALSSYSCSQEKDNSITYDVTAEYVDTARIIGNSKQEAPQSNVLDKSEPEEVKTEAVAANLNEEPYRLGREHAARLHEQCKSQGEVRDELLDINARITLIRSRIGDEAAVSYKQGLKDYLTEVADTLASLPF